jgi:large subunit ribosomal protein L25
MQTVAINAQARPELGKKATKSYRNQGLIPCVMYGNGKAKHFATTLNEVKNAIYTPDFKLIEITLEGELHQCIIKEVQYHPTKDNILHIDFLQLIEGNPVKLEVPLRFFGNSPGLKAGGKLVQSIRRVKIKTLPSNIVDELRLDISSLELGQSIRVRDIKVDENIEILIPGGTPVALIEIPRALRAAAAAAAAATTKKGKK